MEKGEKMVDEKLDHWEKAKEHIRKLKDIKEGELKEINIKLVKEFENKEKKLKPIRKLIQKAKTDENPLKIEKYASDVVSAEEQGYKKTEEKRDLLIAQFHSLDYLEREIELRIVYSTESFSNKEEATKKKGGWWKNE